MTWPDPTAAPGLSRGFVQATSQGPFLPESPHEHQTTSNLQQRPGCYASVRQDFYESERTTRDKDILCLALAMNYALHSPLTCPFQRQQSGSLGARRTECRCWATAASSAQQQHDAEAPKETSRKISQVAGYATRLKKVYPRCSQRAASLSIPSSCTNVNLFHPAAPTGA